MTTTPTRPGMNGATQTSGWPANRATPGTLVHGRRIHEVRRDLDAGHEVALVHDLAIERGEDLEGIDPVDAFQFGDAHVEHTRNGRHEVHPALGRTPDGQARTGDSRGQAQGRVILVEFAGLGDDDADGRARIRRREQMQVVRRESPALRPAFVAERQIAREDGTDQARRGTAAGGDPFEPHGRCWVPALRRSDPAQPRARAACTPRPCGSDRRYPRGCRCSRSPHRWRARPRRRWRRPSRPSRQGPLRRPWPGRRPPPPR